MSLYYLILWNQVDILQKYFKKDHVHMRLWTRFYGLWGASKSLTEDEYFKLCAALVQEYVYACVIASSHVMLLDAPPPQHG